MKKSWFGLRLPWKTFPPVTPISRSRIFLGSMVSMRPWVMKPSKKRARQWSLVSCFFQVDSAM